MYKVSSPATISVDEEYPVLLRRIAGVFRHSKGKVQSSKNGSIVNLAKRVRGQVMNVAEATGTLNKDRQIQIVLDCLNYLESSEGQRKLVYCTSQKVWSLDKAYLSSQKRESCRFIDESNAAASSKPRRMKRSRQKLAA